MDEILTIDIVEADHIAEEDKRPGSITDVN